MTCNTCIFSTDKGDDTVTVYCEVNKMDMLKTYPECDMNKAIKKPWD